MLFKIVFNSSRQGYFHVSSISDTSGQDRILVQIWQRAPKPPGVGYIFLALLRLNGSECWGRMPGSIQGLYIGLGCKAWFSAAGGAFEDLSRGVDVRAVLPKDNSGSASGSAV